MASPIIFVLLILQVSLALADICETGLEYCGWNLLNKGDFHQQISNALRSNNQPEDDTHVNATLFSCTNGGAGDLTFKTFCSGSGCQAGEINKSDFCQSVAITTSPTTPVASPSTTQDSASALSFTITLSSLPTSSSTIAPSPASNTLSNPPKSPSQKNTVALGVGIGVGLTLFLVLVGTTAVLYIRRKRIFQVTETAGGGVEETMKRSLDDNREVVGIGARPYTPRTARRIYELDGERIVRVG